MVGSKAFCSRNKLFICYRWVRNCIPFIDWLKINSLNDSLWLLYRQKQSPLKGRNHSHKPQILEKIRNHLSYPINIFCLFHRIRMKYSYTMESFKNSIPQISQKNVNKGDWTVQRSWNFTFLFYFPCIFRYQKYLLFIRE